MPPHMQIVSSTVQTRPLTHGHAPTPFGSAVVAWDDVGVCGLGFGADAAVLAYESPRNDAAAERKLTALLGSGEPSATPPVIHLCGTQWQLRVWQALYAIPRGQTSSYGAIAAALGAPKSARAVGAAVGKNPVAWIIPCHRVIGKTGALTGFRWGLAVKTAMLKAEGITVSVG